MIACELMLGYLAVDRYMARRAQQSKSPELFDNDGNARWITIGAEQGTDGGKHGGHPVYIGKDGEMKTGKFAGKTLGEAFGKEKEKPGTDRTGAAISNEETESQRQQSQEKLRQRLRSLDYDNLRKLNREAMIKVGDEIIKDIGGLALDELNRRMDDDEATKSNFDKNRQDLEKKYARPESEVIADTQADADRLSRQIGKNVHVARVKQTGEIVAISDEQTSDPRVEVISSHGKPSSPSDSLQQLDADRKLKQGRFHALQEELQPMNERALLLERAVREAGENKVGKNGEAWNAANRDYQKLSKQLQTLNAKRKPLLDSWSRLQDESNEAHRAYNKQLEASKLTDSGNSAPPSPGIAFDTRSNESAKANDQMGLFGDVANVPRGPATLPPGGESKGKQQSLFDTKGDPDQMLMFDDGVTPEDRVMKFGWSGLIRDHAAELVRYWGLSAESLGELREVERYGSDHWKDQIRDNLGRWTKEGIPEVSVKDIDQYQNSGPKLRNWLRNWAMENLRNRVFVNKEKNWSIKIDKEGIKKAAAQGTPSAMALIAIRNILENGIYLESKPPRTGEPREVVGYHYFGHPIRYQGKIYAVRAIIKEAAERTPRFEQSQITAAKKFYSLHAIEINEGLPQIPESRTSQETGNPSASNIDKEASTVKSTDKEKYSAPTEAQREAGNYPKRHIRLHGLDISIETTKGVRRRPEWPPMPCDYGYIRGTVGKDKDHVDVFVGPNKKSELVVVVDQVDQYGKFDEHKVLLGFSNEASAISQYKKAYTAGWKVGPVTVMTINQFKAWLKGGSQNKPLERQVSKYSSRFFSVPA